MKNISKHFIWATVMLTFTAFMAGCDAYPPDNSGFTPETPELHVYANDVENVPREKNTLTIPVTSNLPWHATTDVGWITFENMKGNGEGECVIQIALNTTRNDRTGTVRIWITDESVETFKIVQAPTVPGENPMDYFVKTDGDETADGLSWETATTLPMALEMAVFGDKVHVAAGKYTPWAIVNGGNTAYVGDKTFEFMSNITIIGGYPADAAEGAQYDPEANETIFSGAMDDGTSFHVVVITAEPDPDWKLTLKGITISGGVTNATSSSVTINGTAINRNQAGGIVVVDSAVDFVDCTIKGNKATANGNIYITGILSNVNFENCLIMDNTCDSNCAALFNSGSTVTVNNCTFDSNLAAGVGGAVYAFHASQKSYTYIYNSMFTGNMVNSTRAVANITRAGAGVYARENSEVVIVNCTFSGNEGGNGGAISAHGTATAACKLDIINCTISGNIAQNSGGGIHINNSFATVRMYNTIVSGNTAAAADNNNFFFNGSGITFAEKFANVEGSDVYDPSGVKVAASFDAATMLGQLADNGGKTKTMALTGSGNPALTNGMSETNLTALGLGFSPEIPAAIITYDQRGVSRSGKSAIGAWVGE